jgi:hypothetical protein
MQTAADVLFIIYFCFYTVCIFVAHYAYKHFKNRVYDELLGGQTYSNLIPGGMGSNSDYEDRAPERPLQSSPQSTRPQQPQSRPQQQGFNAFAGTAVQIG